MSKTRKAVNFKELLSQMKKDELAAEKWPTIVGGECGEAELLDWLDGLNLQEMPYHIWSFTDHCTISDDGPPESAGRLERARLFGKGGDLDIRRHGQDFFWRYVGKAAYAPKHDKKQTLEWPGNDTSPVYCRKRTALLWGTREKEQKQWFDDRVSGARLTYFSETPPLPDNVEERVNVKFSEYTQAGRTLVVWLLKLERYKEAKNG